MMKVENHEGSQRYEFFPTRKEPPAFSGKFCHTRQACRYEFVFVVFGESVNVCCERKYSFFVWDMGLYIFDFRGRRCSDVCFFLPGGFGDAGVQFKTDE